MDQSPKPRILIIDDDESVCGLIATMLERKGLEARSAYTLSDGLLTLRREPFDVVFLDVLMPDGNGLDLIETIHRLPSAPEVIILTGEADPGGARLAIENGAWDYVPKGSSLEDIYLPLTRALEYRGEKQKNPARIRAFRRDFIVGESQPLTACLEEASLAAACDLPVLVAGGTGTGKELLAKAIHHNSPRADRNFVVVDCAALPETLVESILFGHEAGAYTGAGSKKEGLLKQADQGTLFLDEVGELSLGIQKAFLRFLQERSFRRVGGANEIKSDFRLIAATNRDLVAMVREGRFRQDLLYRLNSLLISLPDLKDRPDDIQMLTTYRLQQIGNQSTLSSKGFSAEVLEMLCGYDWPGNIRELFNVIDQAFVSAADNPTIYPAHLPSYIRIKATLDNLERKTGAVVEPESPQEPDLKLKEARERAVAEFEKRYLTELMARTGWNIREACRVAEISRPRLYELLRKYSLSR